jgi:hypothetical protein
LFAGGSTATVRAGAATVTGRFSPGDHAVNQGKSTSDPRIYGDSAKLAIARAGPAFDAEIPVNHGSLFLIHLENLVGTDLHTALAAETFVCIIFQG